MTLESLERHVAWVRLQAERALLLRLNAGFGFADGRSAGELFLREPAARERLGRGSLRPEDTHRAQLTELEHALEALARGRSEVTALTVAADRLGLNAAERALLEIAVAYALDNDVRDLLAHLAGRRRQGLYVELCRELAPELAALGSCERVVALDAPLRRLRALELHPTDTGLAGALIAPTSLLMAALDGRLELGDLPLTEVSAASVAAVRLSESISAAVSELIPALQRQPASLVIFCGARGTGRRAAAHELAASLGATLLDLELPAVTQANQAAAVGQALALAVLGGHLLFIDGLEEIFGSDGRGLDRGILRLLEAHPQPVLASTGQRSLAQLPIATTVHAVTLPRPELETRTRDWSFALSQLDGLQPTPALAAELAARYVIGPGLIGEVIADAARAAAAQQVTPTLDQVETAVSRRLALRIGSFGTLVSRRARFDEMVLPQDVGDTLRDMIAMVHARSQILESWGFERHLGLSRGVSALFSGEPGTGKTMAASVVSSELGLELMRIDLSSVISKWVGETEKNLAKIFDEAQSANAMLLFDEADSLFAKRTEVKSAQDRFANLEVNYILQRMETFDGISILTTNLENAIDPAFTRRLNFRVRFPSPEVDERESLWRRLVPPGAGLEGHTNFRALAERFEMSGGHIKNAVVRAAVIAARDGRTLRGSDLVAGAHHEYLELGKVMPEFDAAED